MSEKIRTFAPDFLSRIRTRTIISVISILESTRKPTCAKNATVESEDMKDEIVLYQPNDQLSLEVKVENDTVWLNRNQMAVLFDRDVKTIGKHINNALQEELAPVVAKFAPTQNGTQAVAKNATPYENQVVIDFFVRAQLPPAEQIFFEGEFFEARVLLEKLIKMAKKRVIIIDGYIDAATFEMLDVRAKGVTAEIYSDGEYKTLRDTHNASKGKQPINTHKWSKPSHDRWVIIDGTIYHCGHSVKDLGKKLSAIMKMDLNPEIVLREVR